MQRGMQFFNERGGRHIMRLIMLRTPGEKAYGGKKKKINGNASDFVGTRCEEERMGNSSL